MFLYYSYLNYQESKKQSIKDRLFQWSVSIYVLFVLVLISLLLGLFFLVKNSLAGMIISLVCEFVFCEICNYEIDSFRIKNFSTELKLYWEECKIFKNWLRTNGVWELDSIREIMYQVEEQIKSLKLGRETADERLEKWIQTIAVPIILIFITEIINKGGFNYESIALTTNILLLFFILVFFTREIRNMQWFSQKREINRLISFSMDLQGVLNLEQFHR